MKKIIVAAVVGLMAMSSHVSAASLESTCNDYGYFKAKDKDQGVSDLLMATKFKRVKEKGGFDEHRRDCTDEMVKGKWRYEREEGREERRDDRKEKRNNKHKDKWD